MGLVGVLALESGLHGGGLYPLAAPSAAPDLEIAENKAAANQSPLLRLRRVSSKRTTTRQQLDCAKTL
jgi:hypothetical protein